MSKPSVEHLDLSEPNTAAAVLQLQHEAYRIEADLIGSEDIPPLHESLGELARAPLQWLGVREAGGGVEAALAYTAVDGIIDIDRLIVSPTRFRHGYGTALVAKLGQRATITVSTGSANTPAHRFYEALGFRRTHDEEVTPGLFVTHFTREVPP
jgi:ribosomal protein S18 acetylase RimI-like enzyme